LSETYTLTGIVKAVTAEASRKFKALEKVLNRTSKEMTVLEQAGATAAGMLMRDMVNGLTASFGEAVKLGGSIETLSNSFDSLKGDVTDEVLSLETLREATQGTVSDVDLLTAANQAMALGIPKEELNDLFSAAMDVGHAMGRTTLQAVNDLATGMGRGSRLILDNLGILVDTEQAYVTYAETLGKTSSELTESEKKTAFMTAAMVSLNEKAEVLTGTTSEAQIAQEQFSAQMVNVKSSVGGALTPLGKFAPILEKGMPIIGQMATIILPGLIKQYGLTGLATKAWALITNLSLKSVKTAFMSNPVGLAIMLIVTAITLLYAAWESNWMGIRDTFAAISKWIMDKIGWLIDGLKAIGGFFAKLFGLGGEADKASKKMDEFKQPIGFEEEKNEFGMPVVPAQHGFDGMVRKPTWFLAGERGPERVSITPGGGDGQGAGSVSITVDLRGAYTSRPVEPEKIYKAVSDVTRKQLRRMGIKYEAI
jgi:hypothetical protein